MIPRKHQTGCSRRGIGGDPVLEMEEVCTCGASEVRRFVKATEKSRWPHDLGHAIRRFVRRAEVSDLHNTLLGAAHNWRAAWRPEDDMDRGRHWSTLLTALRRLESLALEGT